MIKLDVNIGDQKKKRGRKRKVDLKIEIDPMIAQEREKMIQEKIEKKKAQIIQKIYEKEKLKKNLESNQPMDSAKVVEALNLMEELDLDALLGIKEEKISNEENYYEYLPCLKDLRVFYDIKEAIELNEEEEEFYQEELKKLEEDDPYKNNCFSFPELRNLAKLFGLKLGGKREDIIARIYDPEIDNGKYFGKKPKIIKKSIAEATRILTSLGVKSASKKSRCLRKAIQRGYANIDKEGLNSVVFEGFCKICNNQIILRVENILNQSDVYSNVSSPAYKCFCGKDWYLSSLCEGRPKLNEGIHHHHCEKCRGLGICIGSRNGHCSTW